MSCDGCMKADCGSCTNCLDKKRFGGPGKKKKTCVQRVCTAGDSGMKNPREYILIAKLLLIL